MARHWQLISPEEAKSHPLYGVKNWLAIFALFTLLAPCFYYSSLDQEAQKLGTSAFEILSWKTPVTTFITLVIFTEILCSFIIFWLLYYKHPKFRFVTSVTLLGYGPVISLIGIANSSPNIYPLLALFLVRWAVFCAIWIPYLQVSKRVLVTFEHCILSRKEDTTLNKEEDHDDLYKIAYEEMSTGQFEPASWAKAFAHAEGNQDKAKALYIKYRVEQLATSQAKKLQVTLAKADTLAQPESKASVFKENSGLVIAIAIVGLVGVGLLVSQIQKPSGNYPQITQAQTPQSQPVVQAQTPQPQPVVQAQTPQPQPVVQARIPQPQKLLTPFQEKLQKANAGDAIAQNNLGVMYEGGEGVPQDYTQAAYWYRKAADQGSKEAQNNLGVMYAKSQGIPQDYTQAAYWYRKAADQGSKEAQFNLGVMYANGQGVSQDYTQAAYWYRKSADQGGASAQYNLGLMYYNGQGVPQDYTQAFSWFRKAADQGHAEAQYNIGQMYGLGQGVHQDDITALMWIYISYAHSEGTPLQASVSEILNKLNKLTVPQEQINEAQQRAKAWLTAHPKKN
jgi:TPR repeat protein